MLAHDQSIAGYDARTAVILGDAVQVRELLARDPESPPGRHPDRVDRFASGLSCRWHQLDPARANGLTEVARLCSPLDRSRRPAARRPGRAGGQSSPLLCAVAGAPNPAITRLLPERGPGPCHVVFCWRRLRIITRMPPAPATVTLDIASTTALSSPLEH